MTMTIPVDAATERLARKVAEATGKPLSIIIRQAIEAQARLAGVDVERRVGHKPSFDRMMEISGRCSARSVLDDRTPDAIIGYDEFGVPA